MTWLCSVLVAAVLVAGSPSAYAATQASSSGGHFLLLVGGLVALFIVLGLWRAACRHGIKGLLESALRLIVAVPGTWAAVSGSHELFGVPPASLVIPLWFGLVIVMFNVGGALVPRPLRNAWASLFGAPAHDTHGTARFGSARDATRHLAPAAPADAFVLGNLRDARGDRRFRQDGHILTCAPTGGCVLPR